MWLPPSRCAIADELPSSAQSEEVESLGLVSGGPGAAALGGSEDTVYPAWPRIAVAPRVR